MFLNFSHILVFGFFTLSLSLSFPSFATESDWLCRTKTTHQKINCANHCHRFCQDELLASTTVHPEIVEGLLEKIDILTWPNIEERVLNSPGYAFVIGAKLRKKFREAYPNFYIQLNFPQRTDINPKLLAHNRALIHYFGLDGKEDQEEGIRQIKQNADQGYFPSQFILIWQILSYGVYDENAFAIAQKWMKEALQSDPDNQMASHLLNLLKNEKR